MEFQEFERLGGDTVPAGTFHGEPGDRLFQVSPSERTSWNSYLA